MPAGKKDEGSAQRTGELARRHFSQGRCCSEAMILAVIECHAPGMDPALAAAGTGLCGGMGNHRATCGVFTGGAVALGMALADAGISQQRIKELSARYQQELEQLAGGHLCDDLLDRMGLFNLNKRLCRKLTGQGAELLDRLIAEAV